MNNKITNTEGPIVAWTLDNDDVRNLVLGQKFHMNVTVEFVSRLTEDATGLVRLMTIRERKGDDTNCCLHLTVPIEGLHRNVSITLKRIPNRLLRAGNKLIILANGEIFWKPEVERFRGAIVKNIDNFLS